MKGKFTLTNTVAPMSRAVRLHVAFAFILFFAILSVIPAFAQVAAPTGVMATGISTTTIRVTWTDNSNNEDAFFIYRANQQAAQMVYIGQVAANVTTFDDTTLTHPMTRFYRVLAVKATIDQDLSPFSLGVPGQTSSLPPNQNPVASNDSENGRVPATFTGNVLANDTDPDGNTPLTVQQPNAHIAADGSYSISHLTTAGVHNFPYVALDTRGGSDGATLTITTTVNSPPVAVDDFDTCQENVACEGDVLVNDTDTDGDILSVVQPNAAGIAADGSYSITKSAEGIYNNAYSVQDGQGGTDDGNLQLTVTAPPPTGGLVAFPGAEGYGRFSIGGRGGAIIHVTSLNDTGAGTLRACMEASGPRNCVFRTNGTILIDTPIVVDDPYLNVDCQTAPGPVLVRNGPNMTQQLIRGWSHDIMVRHCIFASGGPHRGVTTNGDNFLISGIGTVETSDEISNIVLANNAFYYGSDENVDVSPYYDKLSLLGNIVALGLKPHARVMNFRGCGASFIDGLIAHSSIRNPNITCGKEVPGSIRGGGSKDGHVEFRNNVVYNGTAGYNDVFNGRGENWSNIAGNVYKRGPDTPSGNTSPYPVDVRDFASNPQLSDNGCPGGSNCAGWLPAGTSDPQHVCVQDNADVGDVSGSRPAPIHNVLDPRDATATNVTGGSPVLHSTDCVNDPASDPAAPRELTGTVRDADADPTAAINAVLADVGPFYWNRDTLTNSVIGNVLNGTGSIPTCTPSGLQCGGLTYPNIAAGTPYPDADNDGIDDTKETIFGTNPNGDIDGDGYTNYEEFSHSLATQ